MVDIKTLKFDSEILAKAKSFKYGTNWPVVYIINNDNEAYIGETTNFGIRSNQHLANEVRKKLSEISVIGDDTFNKSSVLDLEAFLIKYMSADDKFKLQNSNTGLKNHNYYQRKMYESKFKEIWYQLKSKGLVNNDLKVIENSDLFKFSPYKTLTTDQYMIVNDILGVLAHDVNLNENSTFLIEGGAGTGKTILGIYLIKLLSEYKKDKNIIGDEQDDRDLNNILTIHNSIGNLKIALVVPMENLRSTLKRVFKSIDGLSPSMVLSPHDVANSDYIYDLLIVDEAHRLKKRKNLTQYATFDQNNKNFRLGDKGTELDWIILKSKYQILFYDEKQSIKPSDVNKENFDELMLNKNYHPYKLEVQLRCLNGGNEYVDYVNSIFSDSQPSKFIEFKKYDFKIFDNVNELVEEIKYKNNELGLCRTVAGYAWKWTSKDSKLPQNLKNKTTSELIDAGIYDLEIDGYKYIWNSKASDWINSPNSKDEIGSIHTTQGFDLNYTGIIIGNELKYNLNENKFLVDKSNYYDVKGKNDTTDQQLLSYILNIYTVMFTRGMLGTYVYVCDPGLREYLSKFIKSN